MLSFDSRRNISGMLYHPDKWIKGLLAAANNSVQCQSSVSFFLSRMVEWGQKEMMWWCYLRFLVYFILAFHPVSFLPQSSHCLHESVQTIWFFTWLQRFSHIGVVNLWLWTTEMIRNLPISVFTPEHEGHTKVLNETRFTLLMSYLNGHKNAATRGC